MKLRRQICPTENILVHYSNDPLKEIGAYGYMQPVYSENQKGALITVTPSLTGKKKLEILAHEALHVAYPDLTENQVVYGGEVLAKVIWDGGFRPHNAPKGKSKKRTKKR